MKSGPTYFAILLNKTPNRETSQELVARHVEHLRTLDAAGRLVLCGPFIDHPSGMVIVNAPTKEAAIAMAEADPFVSEGVRSFEVRTWVVANAENNYLT
jgi:uncharacterized protein YciI